MINTCTSRHILLFLLLFQVLTQHKRSNRNIPSNLLFRTKAVHLYRFGSWLFINCAFLDSTKDQANVVWTSFGKAGGGESISRFRHNLHIRLIIFSSLCGVSVLLDLWTLYSSKSSAMFVQQFVTVKRCFQTNLKKQHQHISSL